AFCFFFQAEDGIRDFHVTGVQTCALPISPEGVTLSGVSVGGYHTCANGSDGSVYCWGYNMFGQIGNGTFLNAYSRPVKVQARERSEERRVGKECRGRG